ncbi:hypothetical protein ACF073_05860 [Streptomyces sp. NPDC015171]|uniref:hypothetical protein n=1 Tax=Streptomyces sp. NPDC015171 TaxID=3364945 RepID=UPI0037010B9F
MMNRTAPNRARTRAPAMTIRVYTVTREGIVTPPQATVIVPRDYVPTPEQMNTQLPPCACPWHRQTGDAR